ncbi:mechanosensitive ion channel family protein [Owenweeksia hongkongensis]|uniref:mechanosensitive ion channel family protein n=1 Tax=Owenweeksia hongkongensis TaxID=253245 RepID=UPI003A92CC27
MDKQVDFDINKAYELVTGKLEAWIKTAVEMLPNFVLAILIVVAFVLIGKLLKKLFEKIFRRITDNKSLQSLLSSILYLGIVAIGTFIALSVLQLDGAVTSLLAGAGVIGLALGFAFQEIASNFIAGTMMSIRKPFKIDDLIETNDFFGIIQHIHLRTTELRTMQGQIVQIPNSMVFKNPIINYTQLGKRRIDISVGVTYGEDLPKAKKVAKEAIESLEGLTNDDVTIYYTDFGGSSINFVIRYWIPFTNKHFEYLAKQDEGVIGIKQAFDKNDVPIPFPIRTLDFGDVDFKSIFSTYSKQVSTTSGNSSSQTSDNSNGE